MASGKKGKMAAIKKRSALLEKHTNNLNPRHGDVEDILLEERQMENPNEMMLELNDLPDLVVMEDEVGDPDIGVLVHQEEELLDDDVIETEVSAAGRRIDGTDGKAAGVAVDVIGQVAAIRADRCYDHVGRGGETLRKS